MAKFLQNLKTFAKFFADHPLFAANGVLCALTAGTEQLFERIVFECPKEVSYNKGYALAFGLVPFAVLVMMGIIGSNIGKRVCQGTRSRLDKWYDCCQPGCQCHGIWLTFCRALVLPLVWIFVCLIDGDVYSCYFWLPSCTEESHESNVTKFCIELNRTEEYDLLNKRSSQYWGWISLVVIFGAGTLVIICNRCCQERTYFDSRYADIIQNAEREKMETLMQEKATEEAKLHVNLILSTEMEPDDWQFISKEDPTDRKHFSAIREWLSTEAGEAAKAAAEKAAAEKAAAEKAAAEKAAAEKAAAEKAAAEKAAAEKAAAEKAAPNIL